MERSSKSVRFFGGKSESGDIFVADNGNESFSFKDGAWSEGIAFDGESLRDDFTSFDSEKEATALLKEAKAAVSGKGLKENLTLDQKADLTVNLMIKGINETIKKNDEFDAKTKGEPT